MKNQFDAVAMPSDNNRHHFIIACAWLFFCATPLISWFGINVVVSKSYFPEGAYGQFPDIVIWTLMLSPAIGLGIAVNLTARHFGASRMSRQLLTGVAPVMLVTLVILLV